MPGNRAALSLVPDEPDQVPRLERFRAEHPEVIILLRGAMPKAWVGGRKLAQQDLVPARVTRPAGSTDNDDPSAGQFRHLTSYTFACLPIGATPRPEPPYLHPPVIASVRFGLTCIRR